MKLKRISLAVWVAGLSLASVFGGSVAMAADAPELGPTSTEKVYFRGWPFMPEVVSDNVNQYNTELKGNIDYATVTHGDYPTLMEKSLIAKDNLDIIYANPPTAVRFYEAGWIAPADDVPNITKIMDDLYPNVKDAWTYKGKLLGLSYFLSTRGMIMINDVRKDELKVTASPKNWDEFYDHILELNKQGAKDIYLPHWFNEFYGISWSFIWEVLNRGGTIINAETYQPTLDAAGPAGKTLEDWKAIFNAKMVPEEVLSYNEASQVEGFSSGRYVYAAQVAYNLGTFNDPKKSKIAGHVSFLPYQGSSWGLLDSALYLRTTRERSPALDEDARRFQSWYGYHDQKGAVRIGERWAEKASLFSGYKSVMEKPETKAALQKMLSKPEDYDKLLDVYTHSPAPEFWKTVWAEEFNSYLRTRLGTFLLKDEPVADVIGDLNNKISELNKKFKLGQ